MLNHHGTSELEAGSGAGRVDIVGAGAEAAISPAACDGTAASCDEAGADVKCEAASAKGAVGLVAGGVAGGAVAATA